LLGLILAGNTVTAQPTGDDWPAYLHDAAASGFTSESLISPSNVAHLKSRTGWPVALANGAVCPSTTDVCLNRIASQPTVATEAGSPLVYAGSWNGSEYALCASTCTIGAQTYTSGQVVWSTYVGRTSSCGTPTQSVIYGVTSAAATGTALIGGVSRSVVFVGGGGNIDITGAISANGTAQVLALDALSGAILWQTSLGASPSHYMWSSPVLANGSLYVGISSTGDCPLVQGGVAQLDPNSGAVLHTFYTVPPSCKGASVWGSASVDTSGDVYVATGNGGGCKKEPYATAVLKLSATLSLLSSWQVPPPELPGGDFDFGSTPTQFSGTVAPGGQPRSLVGVPNKNGIYYVLDQSNISTGPVARVRVAVGGSNPALGSISPSSWDGSTLYIAGGKTTINGTTYNGSLSAYDPNNFAAPLWQHGFPGGPIFGAVSTDPGLAVVGAGTTFAVVASSSGTPLFSAGVGAEFFGAASISHGVVYIGDGKGRLRAWSVNGL
jgi:polyvinyl alcohol dehydrogenase (cytochrome)